MFEYKSKVIKIIDGDTIVADIDLGFHVTLVNQSVRLFGIDTPESRTNDKIEKTFGLLSKEQVKMFCFDLCGGDVLLRTYLDRENDEKFGRILAKVINPQNGEILNDLMVKNGFAVPYMGENKEKIKERHLQNRKVLIDNRSVMMTYAQAGIKI